MRPNRSSVRNAYLLTCLLTYGSSDAHVAAAARKAQLARLALLASRLEELRAGASALASPRLGLGAGLGCAAARKDQRRALLAVTPPCAQAELHRSAARIGGERAVLAQLWSVRHS